MSAVHEQPALKTAGEAYHWLTSQGIRLRLRPDGEIAAIPGHKVTPEIEAAIAPHREGLKEIAKRLDKAEQEAGVVPLRGNRVDPETGEVIPLFVLTDYGNAERLIHHHGTDLRYCHPFGKWLVWDGVRWGLDNTAEVIRRAKATARNLLHEAADESDDNRRKELIKHASKSEGESRIRAMIALAESEPVVPVLPDDLDANPWLLNVANGTINLRTGILREHRRADLITKLAPVVYDPAAACPTFDAFLARILPGEELRRFVQRAAGYSLTGDTREDVIFINYGTGNNGKSTLMSTLLDILGDYAMQTPTEMLMVKRNDGIPNDIARLKGARLVSAAEAEEGRRLAEGLVKQLTGGDRISARFMRGEWFDFEPDFKTWLSTNHKPIIRGTDNGIWRRIRMIPYTETIPEQEQDEGMSDKLRAEAAGILAWMVRGCLDWQRSKLGMPDEVKKANAEYRAEMDILGNWIGDCCIEGFNMLAPSGELYESYQVWCTENGERTISKRAFGQRLAERGYTDKKGTGGTRHWLGIGLLTTPQQGELVAQVAQVAQVPTLAHERGVNSANLKSAPLAPLAPLDDDDDDFQRGTVGKTTGLVE